MYQYRITVNGTQSEIADSLEALSGRWTHIHEIAESRGGISAVLEERYICTPYILPMLTDTSRWLQLDENTVVGPWDIIVRAESGE
jgi:hypothetical protein